jgi:hypothetical protein
MLLTLFLFMCSNIADIFDYPSINGNGALDTTIGRDKISPAIRRALAEDLTQEDTMDMQTNPKRVTIYHVPQGDRKNRHTISAGSDSEHVREYSNYLSPDVFLTQHS